MPRQEAHNAVFASDPDPEDPLLGARLRFALACVEQRILQALTEAGYEDIQVTHFKVLRFPPPENERPIDLANRAGITKQAMNYLLVQLEEMGYLTRQASGTASTRLITLTPKGWDVARLQRETVRAVEADWENRLGRKRFRDFYAVLQEMTDPLSP